MWERVQEALVPSKARVVLDVWNGDRIDRRSILKKLRKLGARRVVAWYFVTPVKFVEEWFWKKPGVAKINDMQKRQEEGLSFYSEDSPRRDHELFHELASGIGSDGFDKVVRINPVVMGPEQVLGLRTSLEF